MKKFLATVMIAAMSFGAVNSTFAMPQTKKDGTADKRYKANKTPAGPTTKSGKPDMRYKSNKPATAPAKPAAKPAAAKKK